MLRKIMTKKGWLTVVDANGRSHDFKVTEKPHVTVRLHDKALHLGLFFNAALLAGEAYMDGRLTVDDDRMYDFLDLVFANLGWVQPTDLGVVAGNLARMVHFAQTYNPIGRSKQNVAHHYDLSGRLYDLFLDRDRQYSCGYFTDKNNSLEQAQHDKKTHIAAKLLLKPEHRVLDIGCGWGGMALYLNRITGADVTGVTLSEEQHTVANQRIGPEQKGKVRFQLEDYRQVNAKFDRIVSVGMFEHVGRPQYATFFKKVADLLTDDGVMLLHTIGRADGPGITNPWIRKYIFPGGYSPALSEIMPYIQRARLTVTDVEVLRLHYAETLKNWRKRFNDNRDEIRAIYDERFCRMWDFYLAASEVTFRYAGHVNFQIQIAKRQEDVPLTRDYLVDWERRHHEDLDVSKAAE
jgi:cyclopropane-fatty-acyl-phospholipid synthase